jgi:hypothetical protein
MFGQSCFNADVTNSGVAGLLVAIGLCASNGNVGDAELNVEGRYPGP